VADANEPGDEPSGWTVSKWLDRLYAGAFAALPHHALSRLALAVTRVRTRAAQPVIRWFIRRFGVAMDEAAEPDPRAYPSFNAFFTRALKPGSRPLEGDETTLVSPVDGRISHTGVVDGDRVIQAKDLDYSLSALLGGDPEAARTFVGGVFATLYLAPGDYHRIHLPLAGSLRRMVYVPGRLYSVSPRSVRAVDALFTRNERVCAFFETASGPLALAMVGALNVGAIETRWAGPVTPPQGVSVADWDYSGAGIHFSRADEIAKFNMGSTVVVLAPAGTQRLAGIKYGDRLRVGHGLAKAVRVTAQR
jgi:phosphatidylserine decarboxylase